MLNVLRCQRCGRWLNPYANPPQDRAPSAGNMTTHMEGHTECKVIAIPHPGRDAFGHLIAHVTGPDPEEGPSDLRSLSFLVDY
ncbi:hypothetical protein ACOMHN_062798 [Nucella lapillus]